MPMFTKGNIVYADAYKYLRHKTKKVVALSVQGDGADYEELPMNSPLDVETDGRMIFWNNRRFAVRPGKLTRNDVKASVIKSRYSNDEQIAIMLNRERSEKDALLYGKMQEWREFAAEIAGKVPESK